MSDLLGTKTFKNKILTRSKAGGSQKWKLFPSKLPDWFGFLPVYGTFTESAQAFTGGKQPNLK
jgi:hypothetical protein